MAYLIRWRGSQTLIGLASSRWSRVRMFSFTSALRCCLPRSLLASEMLLHRKSACVIPDWGGGELVDAAISKLLTTRVFTSVCPLLVKSPFGRGTRRPGSDVSVGELTTSSFELLLVYLFSSYRLAFTIRAVMKVSTRVCPTLASLDSLPKGKF